MPQLNKKCAPQNDIAKINLFMYNDLFYFITTATKATIKKELKLFNKTVDDAAYNDSDKFLKFLKNKGIAAKEISEVELNVD